MSEVQHRFSLFLKLLLDSLCSTTSSWEPLQVGIWAVSVWCHSKMTTERLVHVCSLTLTSFRDTKMEPLSRHVWISNRLLLLLVLSAPLRTLLCENPCGFIASPECVSVGHSSGCVWYFIMASICVFPMSNYVQTFFSHVNGILDSSFYALKIVLHVFPHYILGVSKWNEWFLLHSVACFSLF